MIVLCKELKKNKKFIVYKQLNSGKNVSAWYCYSKEEKDNMVSNLFSHAYVHNLEIPHLVDMDYKQTKEYNKKIENGE